MARFFRISMGLILMSLFKYPNQQIKVVKQAMKLSLFFKLKQCCRFNKQQKLIMSLYQALKKFFYKLNFTSNKQMWKTIDSFPNWQQIKQKLQGLAHKKHSPQEIINLLKQFRYYSNIDQNQKNALSSEDSFVTLAKLYSKQIPEIFQKVANFVLTRNPPKVPLFRQGIDKQHFFRKQEILYLFCSMMLCLTPRQQFDTDVSQRSKFNYLMDFSFIFSDEEYKTKTVIEYIKRQIDNTKTFDQKMSIHRQVQNRKIEDIINENKDAPMCNLTIEKNEASIEDYYGHLKADFANKFLGGGALLSGCVQEEIMFTNHPQLFTSQLLCEVMSPNECIFLSGYKKYFKNSGYGWSAAFDGPQNHQYTYDPQGRAAQYITAIDALSFSRTLYSAQFQEQIINREILKAYCGFNFKSKSNTKVITGNWGCGAFGGDLRTKFIIQWLACSLAKKQMIYCPFGERQKINDQELINRIKKMKIRETYNLIQKASSKLLKQQKEYNIYKAMKDLL